MSLDSFFGCVPPTATAVEEIRGGPRQDPQPYFVYFFEWGLLLCDRRGLITTGHFFTGGDSSEHSLTNWPFPPPIHTRTHTRARAGKYKLRHMHYCIGNYLTEIAHNNHI
jgi:hypothetical protein